MARRAVSAEARLAHLELAGRYSIKAAAACGCLERPAPAQLHLRVATGEVEADAVFGGVAYYERLEAGARWMASRSDSAAAHDGHLAAANRYARLRKDAASNGVCA
jgi:hypothetical protein